MTAEPPHRTALTDIGFCIRAATEVIGHLQRQNLAETGTAAFGRHERKADIVARLTPVSAGLNRGLKPLQESKASGRAHNALDSRAPKVKDRNPIRYWGRWR